MNIINDKNAYILAKYLSLENGGNASYMMEYWDKSGKLNYFNKLYKCNYTDVRFDDLQHVIMIENLCEIIVLDINNVLSEVSKTAVTLDVEVQSYIDSYFNDLSSLLKLKEYKNIKDLSESLCNLAINIKKNSIQLISFKKSGKEVAINTNLTGKDFFLNERIEFMKNPYRII